MDAEAAGFVHGAAGPDVVLVEMRGDDDIGGAGVACAGGCEDGDAEEPAAVAGGVFVGEGADIGEEVAEDVGEFFAVAAGAVDDDAVAADLFERGAEGMIFPGAEGIAITTSSTC